MRAFSPHIVLIHCKIYFHFTEKTLPLMFGSEEEEKEEEIRLLIQEIACHFFISNLLFFIKKMSTIIEHILFVKSNLTCCF